MTDERAQAQEGVTIAIQGEAHEAAKWHCAWTIEKWHDTADYEAGKAPDEVCPGEGNILLTAGITALLTLLQGGGGVAFNTANAYIGVGDSTTAAAIAQTDLQAATNKTRQLVSGAPTVSGNVGTWIAAFGSAAANYAWQEWGLFNASTAGTMLNRAVASLGTKVAGSTWTLTATITIS